MKTQRMNATNMSHMELNNMSNMMGMMNQIQKIGKGKRKIVVKLSKDNKKFLIRFVDEVKKQFTSEDPAMQAKNLNQFFNYLKDVASNKKSTEIKFTFEEYEFMKKMLVDSLRGMNNMHLAWYQIIKKLMIKMLKKQYKSLLAQFK